MDEKISRFVRIRHRKWWIHETAVCKMLHVVPKDGLSVRDQLTVIVRALKTGYIGNKEDDKMTKLGRVDLSSDNRYDIRMEQHGDREEFRGNNLSSSAVSARPRFFCFGFTRRTIKIGTQLTIMRKITRTERNLDPVVARRCQSFWHAWFDEEECDEVSEFVEKDLTAVALGYAQFWDTEIPAGTIEIPPTVLEAIGEEIRDILRACNCVKSSLEEDLLNSPEKKRARVYSPQKQPRVTPTPQQSVTSQVDLLLPSNKQLTTLPDALWKTTLEKLVSSNQLQELAVLEYTFALLYDANEEREA